MKFGKIDVPDSVLWVAGFAIPLVGYVVYHHFKRDPTDIVTDVQIGAGASPALLVTYNLGPSDTIALAVDPSLWAIQGPAIAMSVKSLLAGATRDRVTASRAQLSSLTTLR